MSLILKRITIIFFFLTINSALAIYLLATSLIPDQYGSSYAIANYSKFISTFIFFIFLFGAICLKFLSIPWLRSLKEIRLLLESLVLNHFELTGNQKNMIKDFSQSPQYEISLLGSAFESMMQNIQVTLQKEQNITQSKEMVDNEIRVGREIQVNLLPKLDQLIKKNHNFDIYGMLRQASEVGGDSYDAFFIDKDNLLLMIGDVSGKGIPAAIFMTVSRTLIKGFSDISTQPGEILTAVNNQLCQNNPSSMFVSLFIGILNLQSGLFSYSSAGHPPPYFIPNDYEKKVCQLEMPTCSALGILPDQSFTTHTIPLVINDKVLLYTNIPNEIQSPNGDIYTHYQMEKHLIALRHNSPQQLGEKFLKEIDHFSSNTTQSDDMAILCVGFTPKK